MNKWKGEKGIKHPGSGLYCVACASSLSLWIEVFPYLQNESVRYTGSLKFLPVLRYDGSDLYCTLMIWASDSRAFYFCHFKDKDRSHCHMVTLQESRFNRGFQASVILGIYIPNLSLPWKGLPSLPCPVRYIILGTNPLCLTYFLTLPCGKDLWYFGYCLLLYAFTRSPEGTYLDPPPSISGHLASLNLPASWLI